jgi:hypothetical protein
MVIPSFLRSDPTATITPATDTKIWTYWNEAHGSTTNTVTFNTNAATTGSNYLGWRSWNNDWICGTDFGTTGGIGYCEIDPFFRSTDTGSTASDAINVWQTWNVPQEVREASRRASTEQRERWKHLEQEKQRLYEERQKKEAEAKQRAEALLRSCLTPQQQEELDRLNHFHLLVGDRRYRIKRGRSRNIELLDESGRPIKKLCAHPGEYVPDADTMLAQKLMLETDEEAFLKLANHTPVHYPPEPQTARPSEQVARAV